MSLDGVVESPDKWHFPYFNYQMGDAIGAAMATSDAMLMGRVLYEEWAVYWPQQDPEENPVAARMNGIQKYVVSRTLEKPLEWENSTLIGDNIAEEITRLKEQPGKDISISGSPTLVRSLLQDDLLDELRLMVHPIVVGSGKRLFEEGGIRRRWISSTRRRSARAFSISATSRRKAKAINRVGTPHPGLSLVPIHRSAWKGCSPQFGCPVRLSGFLH